MRRIRRFWKPFVWPFWRNARQKRIPPISGVTNFIMTNPVVVGVDGPYRETYDELPLNL